MKTFCCLFLVLYSALGDQQSCDSGFRRTLLNYQSREDFSVTSHDLEVDSLLEGSGETLRGGYTISFTLKARGQREGPLGPMDRGFKPSQLCFDTKCVSAIDISLVGRTPDPRPSIVDGVIRGWGGTGGGVARGMMLVEKPGQRTQQCVHPGGWWDRMTFRLYTGPRIRARCGRIQVSNLFLRGCIDENI